MYQQNDRYINTYINMRYTTDKCVNIWWIKMLREKKTQEKNEAKWIKQNNKSNNNKRQLRIEKC